MNREALVESVLAQPCTWLEPNPFHGAASPNVDLGSIAGIVEYSPADQVVVVGGGTRIGDLNAALEPGQAIPYGLDPAEPLPLAAMRIADALSLNLPHFGEGRWGTWRHWVLGMKILRPDGQIVTVGSKAVKSVAGYDLHKLFIGARGRWGIPVEVFLRVTPVSIAPAEKPSAEPPTVVRRVARADFEPAVTALQPAVADPLTATLWGSKAMAEGQRFADDWQVMAFPPYCDPLPEARWLAAIDAEFDPTGWFTPHE